MSSSLDEIFELMLRVVPSRLPSASSFHAILKSLRLLRLGLVHQLSLVGFLFRDAFGCQTSTLTDNWQWHGFCCLTFIAMLVSIRTIQNPNSYGHRRLYQCLTGELFHLGPVFLFILIAMGAVPCRGLRAETNERQQYDPVNH